MIQSLTVINHMGHGIELGLRNFEETGFLITSIDGIGPGDAVINTTELSATDGSIFNSARVTSRNIVISLKYMFNPTIEDMRQLSYLYFPLKKPVTLIFKTDNNELMIDGYVESNEPDIFSESETTQISIICPNPFFYSTGIQRTVFSGIEPMFEFPFSNESLTEKLLIMSEIRNKYENVITYYGNVETGITMTIHFLGPATNITVYNVTTREIMKIDTSKIAAIVGSAIIAGDDLVIDTATGEKSATFIRAGKRYNVLNAIDRDADWIKLDLGDNVLAFTAETGEANVHFTIDNYVLSEGV